MKYIIIILFLQLSLLGKSQSNPLATNYSRKLLETSEKIGLNIDSTKTTIRIWNYYYVLELEIESEKKYFGSINYYLDWAGKSKKYRDMKGFVSDRRYLLPEEAKKLHSILVDSMKIDEKVKDCNSKIFISDMCFSYVEYYSSDGLYSSKYCKTSEFDTEISSHKQYDLFINNIVEKEQAVEDLLNKINVDFTISYSSNTQCCCGNEYSPAEGRIGPFR